MAQRSSQLRIDIGDANKLVIARMGAILGEAVYMDASTKRHIYIGERPCRELHKHVRGSIRVPEIGIIQIPRQRDTM